MRNFEVMELPLATRSGQDKLGRVLVARYADNNAVDRALPFDLDPTGLARRWARYDSSCLPQDANRSGVTVHFNPLAILEECGGVFGTNHSWNAVFTSYDCAVAENTTRIGHDRRGGSKERRPGRRSRLHHQHVARLELAGSDQ
jgi:hypothetical protein